MQTTEVIIIGAGPIGIELAAALKLLGVDYVHLEAGQIGQTITWYPRQARFFSSPDRIAIAGVPLHTVDQSKASREEYLAYLRGVVDQFDLEIRTFERVDSIERGDDSFIVRTTRGHESGTCEAKSIVFAIGDMHRPRLLHIPGEGLPHVSHYFDEPHIYFRKRLLIVGGRNSAVEAAIRCQRAGAHVALSYRRGEFDGKSVKYWLLPEIEVLIKTGKIRFHAGTTPTRITTEAVTLKPMPGDAATFDVEADFVLLLVGYEMDTTLLEKVGVELHGENRAPCLDHDTMQTNVAGLYVAGTAAAGTQMRFRLFIENCHPHVSKITRALTGRDAPFATGDKTHSGRYSLPES